ncbi:MAG: hypothetical protein JW941_05075, partial [Candidatus Coatesbacteria bacterium]|nr:hypothetical protein [Candidatus Coatesbacteria bacterium]
EDFLVRRTLFEFVLLGDPALEIPTFQGGAASEIPLFSPTNADFMNNQSIPSYTNSQQKVVQASIASDSMALNFKLVNTTDVQVVARSTVFGPSASYEFNPVSGFKFYIVRAEADDGKEGWYAVNTASSLLCIDADLTDWHNGGLRPIAVDPSLDFDDPEYDVSSLYAYADNEYWHFAFAATCEEDDMSYVLAVDYKDGGYAGTQGESRDGEGNYVTFDSLYAVDAEIYLKHVTWVPWSGWEAFRNCNIHKFSKESSWSSFDLLAAGAVISYSPVGDLVELAIPRSQFEGASDINVLLFSLPSTGSNPAQDSVPSDPATYEALQLGRDSANTLSVFAHASGRPTNCILGAGYFGSDVSSSAGGELQMVAFQNPGAGAPESMEIFLADAPTGLFLNDDGMNGDNAAGDGMWTFSMDVGVGVLSAGDYDVSIVATDYLGGCAGQWPPLLFSFCDELAIPGTRAAQGTIPANLTGFDDPQLAPIAFENGGCTILAAGVSNTATTMFECTIEAHAYVGDGPVDTIGVYYAGSPLGYELTDDGLGADLAAGDGIFSGEFTVDRSILMSRRYTLELVPFTAGEAGPVWPYLHISD